MKNHRHNVLTVVDTRIGKFGFENGHPTKDTAMKLYREMDPACHPKCACGRYPS